MDKYQITATIEKIDCTNDIKLQLKGSGKYSFESEDKNKQKVVYSILEHTINKTKSKFIDHSKKLFYIDIINNKDIAINLFSHANIENKRLKFEIDEKNSKYYITSISKAD